MLLKYVKTLLEEKNITVVGDLNSLKNVPSPIAKKIRKDLVGLDS